MGFGVQSTSALVVALGLAAAAWAVEPYVSVPSAAGVDGKVQIQGKALPAYTNVTVRFAHDGMSPIDMVTQVRANGSFSLKFAPPISGSYLVTVYDSSGKTVGQGRFGHYR